MPSNAFSGVGTVFKRGDGASSETFTAVAEINDISGPSMTRDTIDVTSLDSTGGFREFITGFRDGGTVVLNMNFTRDAYDDFLIDFNSNSTKNYQIVLPDTGNTTFDFTGLVTDLPLSIPPDDKVTAAITLKVTGEVTLSS